MRGRKPAAAALKLLHGRGEGKDSGGREVVQLPFRRVPPKKPAGMSRIASEHWDHVVDQLSELAILTPAHLGPLQVMCETYARWREAEDMVRKKGQVVEIYGRLTRDSDELVLVASRKSPYVTVAEAARRDYVRMATEFGLTPSAENRVGRREAGDGEGDNPFE